MKLSKTLTTRIRNFKRILKEVEPSSLKITLENFERDLNRDREINWWEKLAKNYLKRTKNHVLTLEKKQEIFKDLFIQADEEHEKKLKKSAKKTSKS
jgi:hypothetical protein